MLNDHLSYLWKTVHCVYQRNSPLVVLALKVASTPTRSDHEPICRYNQQISACCHRRQEVADQRRGDPADSGHVELVATGANPEEALESAKESFDLIVSALGLILVGLGLAAIGRMRDGGFIAQLEGRRHERSPS